MNLIEQSPEPQVQEGFRKDDGVGNPRQERVKKWLKKVQDAEKKWDPQYQEMRKNMEFVAGWQWDGQKKLNDERYINNITLRMVNQKVASLYARNPQTVVERRPRLNYQLWDGEMMSIVNAVMEVQQSMAMMTPPSMEALALLQDYEMGRQREKLVDKICETAEYAYRYQVDSHRPEFKEQMKQLVRRVIICKVGYVKMRLCSTEYEKSGISSVSSDTDATTRMQRAQAIYNEFQAGDIDAESGEVEEAQALLLAAGASQTLDEQYLGEYLEFDFPPATSIIPSQNCRALKEFISADFVAHKYKVCPSLVKAIFNIDLGAADQKDGANADEYKEAGADEQEKEKKKVCIYEVFDIRTKSRFFIAEGFKDFVLEPEPVSPSVSGFWPIFALTFNDVEAEEDTNSSPFPPSDVDLIRNPQKEWNRTRDALRDQRNANAPKYVCADGMISEEDEDALANAKPNHVTKLKSLPPNVEPDKFIKVLQVAAIDPAVYDTSPLEKDMLMAGGMQEANIGPAGKDVTATVGTIAEQSRMTMLASNVDDLDSFLSRLAQAGIEMMLKGMSVQTIQRIVGPGAAWPGVDIEDYINEIQIKVQAASSGRPNRAIGIANAQQLMPILMQAGANPHAIVEELVKRLDDTLEVDKFFPLVPSMSGPSAANEEGGEEPKKVGKKSAPGQRTISPPSEPNPTAGVEQPVTA